MSFQLDRDTAQRIAERMLVMRRFEEHVIGLWERKAFTSLYHLYIGQEAGGAAVLDAAVLVEGRRNFFAAIGDISLESQSHGQGNSTPTTRPEPLVGSKEILPP